MSSSFIHSLSHQLAESSKRPDPGTLTLIDRALALLIPYERTRPQTPVPELQALQSLLKNNTRLLSPYLDVASTLRNLAM